MSEAILGIIAYLDSGEVDNLLASIEGGLVEQFVEKFKEAKAKKGEGGIGIPGSSLGAKGGIEAIREEAREATKKSTPVSRLSALRKILVENDYVRYINAVSEGLRDGLIEGELIEVHGDTSTSAFGEFVDMSVEFLNLGTKFSGLFGDIAKIDPQTEQLIRYLEHVTSKGVPIHIAPPKQPGAKRGFDFARILDPGSLRVSKSNLSGTFTVLGRVRRILARNEVVYLYELVPGISKLPRSEFKALLKRLSKRPESGFDLRIEEKDLRLKYPTVIMSPIAMYS